MDMVKEAYEMWSTIEEQSGATLYQYVTKYIKCTLHKKLFIASMTLQ